MHARNRFRHDVRMLDGQQRKLVPCRGRQLIGPRPARIDDNGRCNGVAKTRADTRDFRPSCTNAGCLNAVHGGVLKDLGPQFLGGGCVRTDNTAGVNLCAAE